MSKVKVFVFQEKQPGLLKCSFCNHHFQPGEKVVSVETPTLSEPIRLRYYCVDCFNKKV
jgi:hypothetical protein